MKHSACPTSPKHGYQFDTQEHDVVKVRKPHDCRGGRQGRGAPAPGRRAGDCTTTIEAGSVACTTIFELFVSDTYACVPCALAVGAIRPESS